MKILTHFAAVEKLYTLLLVLTLSKLYSENFAMTMNRMQCALYRMQKLISLSKLNLTLPILLVKQLAKLDLNLLDFLWSSLLNSYLIHTYL